MKPFKRQPTFIFMAYTVSVKVKINGEVKTVTVKRQYRTKEAATKAGERLLKDVKESGMTPVGSFTLRNPSGKETRPYLSKEEYDNLYYWLPIETMENRKMSYRDDPGRLKAGQRKYNTLDEARKGALNQSRKRWEELQYFPNRYSNISIGVYKGGKYLGFVTYNILKGKKEMFNGFEGTWSPAENEDDEVRIKKDGTLIHWNV